MTMATVRSELDLPAELDHAVRVAAAAQPPPRHDLDWVLAKARGHRRRRVAMRSGVAVTLVAALVAAVPILQPEERRGSGIALIPPAAAPADRPIYLGGAQALLLNTSEGEAVYILGGARFRGGAVAQFRLDGSGGTLTAVPDIPNLVGAMEQRAVADGWLAGIGSAGPDGAIARLIIVDEAGKVAVSRDIPQRPGTSWPHLVTASRTTAFYSVDSAEGNTLVSVDLATGAVRDLRTRPQLVGRFLEGNASGNRAVIWPADSTDYCSADVLSASTGTVVAQLRPAIADCSEVSFTLSPDGRLVAALVTHAPFDRLVQRLVVLDVATGQVRKEFELARLPIYKLAAPTDRQMVADVYWSGPTSLVYVRGPHPYDGDRPATTVRTLRV
jgi:hypothetical protein